MKVCRLQMLMVACGKSGAGTTNFIMYFLCVLKGYIVSFSICQYLEHRGLLNHQHYLILSFLPVINNSENIMFHCKRSRGGYF